MSAHPTDDELIEFSEAEPDSTESFADIEEHLQVCEPCRQRLAAIEGAELATDDD